MATKRVTLTATWVKLVDQSSDPFTIQIVSGTAEFYFDTTAPVDSDPNDTGLSLTTDQGLTRRHGDGHVYGRGSDSIVAVVT